MKIKIGYFVLPKIGRKITSMETFELSVIIPCLNEEETLGICIEKSQKRFREIGISGEVVVSDNGSTDRSVEIAKTKGAQVVHVPEKGYGNALYYGIKAAKSNNILMGDADDSYDFGELDKFYYKLQEGYDLVMGCRLPWGGGVIKKGAMPWLHRYFGNPVLTLIGRILFKSKVKDFHCGMRAFSKTAFEKMDLHSSGMEFASEMVLKAELWDLKISQVPITLYPDGRTRKPHLRTWRDGWRHLLFMLLMSPAWLFRLPGLLLIGFGIIVGLATGIQPLKIGAVVFDTNTYLLGATMIILGYQSWLFSQFANKFAVINGLFPSSKRSPSWNINRNIILSVLMAILGVVFILVQFFIWADEDFGRLNYATSIRLVIPGALFIILSFQTFMGSLFMGVLELKRIKN